MHTGIPVTMAMFIDQSFLVSPIITILSFRLNFSSAAESSVGVISWNFIFFIIRIFFIHAKISDNSTKITGQVFQKKT